MVLHCGLLELRNVICSCATKQEFPKDSCFKRTDSRHYTVCNAAVKVPAIVVIKPFERHPRFEWKYVIDDS